MMKVKDLHLCDYAFFAEGGKLSLIGVFDHALVGAVPAVINPFHVVAILGSEIEADTELGLEILDPDDRLVFGSKALLKLGAGKTHNFLLGIAGFKIEKLGHYTIRFLEKRNELARLQLPILLAAQGSIKKV